MKILIDRDLRLNREIKYKSLYEWAVIEVDQHGRKVGSDQIPWDWTIGFTAVSCNICRTTKIEVSDCDHNAQRDLAVGHAEIIRIKLNVGFPGDDGASWGRAKLSMFGTDRTIDDFHLNVYRNQNGNDREKCVAWGTVAYEYEDDFREGVAKDSIVFSLFLNPAIFDRYVHDISIGAVREILFSITNADGFYSEWSPSISTDEIKVLTASGEHKVDVPTDLSIKVPRLGAIGAVELQLNRRTEFGELIRRPEGEKIAAEEQIEVAGSDARASIAGPDITIHTLASLNRSMWFLVLILGIICLNLVFSR